MAISDRTHSVAAPEEKIAWRLLRDLKVYPPFSIRNLVGQFADIEEDDIPEGVDAVLLGKSKRRVRPLIILQRSSPATRKNFTLAHELGHMVIPWHGGTFALHADYIVESVSLFDVVEIEAEANRFASEILMPRQWILDLVSRWSSPADIVREIRKNGVSTLAASFGLIRHLPANYIFAECNYSACAQLMQQVFGAAYWSTAEAPC